MTYDDAKRRKMRILQIELRDEDRFKPNPLGPGFLTRRERYTEVYREIDRRAERTLDILSDFMVGTVH